jgi:hypothetical protein
MSFRLVETGWDNEFTTAAAAVNQELRIVTPFLQPDAARKIVTKKLTSPCRRQPRRPSCDRPQYFDADGACKRPFLERPIR